MEAGSTDADRVDLVRLVMKLRAQGLPARVLAAIETVPRALFLSKLYQAEAYADRALPIECGQTMTAPSVVATAVAALEVASDHKVLEVGCGSGYEAALLATLAARVITLERYRTLVDLAESRFATLRIGNVSALHGDGVEGFPRHAPYDRIMVTAGVDEVPQPLLDQLADGGLLVAPLGRMPHQRLVRMEKVGKAFASADLGPARFTPLVPGVAARL